VSQLNLSGPPPNHTYRLMLEPEEKNEELCVRLLREFVLVILAASFVILLGWICYETLASVSATADEKKWAMSSITAIAGGLTGFLIRR